jgi:threonine synthase
MYWNYSGDTGGAVAHAFLGLPGVRVVVLFPDGKVTPRQEYQFSTLGENVTALAVQGDFDDCQRMVKEVFGNADLRKRVALTSANSINIGRLLPQSFYYFEAWARLQEEDPAESPPILFSVPSGNFGNLAAGLMAKAMGLPKVRFLAATNANDCVPQFLETGYFQPRPSQRTLSTAMDVGDPSNLVRISHLYDNDLDRLRGHVSGRSVSDEETQTCIRRVFDSSGYILDPHSAVGYHALEEQLEM